MEAFYPELRTVHISAVLLSGLVMFARGIVRNLAGSLWVMARPVRILSYVIDTILLAAAVMLAILIGQFPFVDGWLTMKVLLLAAYILLGYKALRGGTGLVRWSSLAGAALVYGFIVTVARAHHPLGLFA